MIDDNDDNYNMVHIDDVLTKYRKIPAAKSWTQNINAIECEQSEVIEICDIDAQTTKSCSPSTPPLERLPELTPELVAYDDDTQVDEDLTDIKPIGLPEFTE